MNISSMSPVIKEIEINEDENDLVDINLNDQDEYDDEASMDLQNYRNLWPRFMNCLTNVLILGAVYLCLWTVDIADDDIDTLFTVLGSSVIVGFLAEAIKLPPLLGMILAGLVLRNVRVQPFSNELPSPYYVFVRSIGLMVILLRSGLELDMSVLQNDGWKAVLSLTCFPAILEAIVSGFCAYALLKIPLMFGMTLGFILSAVSPAVVVSGMLLLQEGGYGVKKGIPSLVIAAASFDDILAISGFSIFVDFAFQEENSSFIENIMHGPSTIVFGLLLGCFGGIILSIEQVWNQSWKLAIALLVCGFSFTFGMSKLHFAGSGMLACLVMGIVYRSRLVTQYLSKDSTDVCMESKTKHASDIALKLAVLWDSFFEPLLFGVIGHALHFDNSFETIYDIMPPILVVLCGLTCRLMMAYIATKSKVGLTTNERLFISLVWIPKATVQAALCSLPLDLARNKNSVDSTDFVKWSEIIMKTSILSILITAPVGSMVVQYLGPRLLSKE